jgi:predicted RNA methylase
MKNSVFSLIGASNHSEKNRMEEDFYSTPEKATIELLKREIFEGNILEPACGTGAISKVLEKQISNTIISKELIDRGYGEVGVDFLQSTETYDNVITNPPFKISQDFVEKALEVSKNKVAMLMRLQFLEGKKRKQLFDKNPPSRVYVFSYRLPYMRGDSIQPETSAMCLCWFVWDKNYIGDTIIKWI